MNDTITFSTVYKSPNSILDIVFVHGLAGHPQCTWGAPSEHKGGPNGESYWPAWLEKDFKDTSAFSLGYPASLFERWARKEMSLFERADSIIDYLLANEIGTRPLAFVTHSLGGLLVKQILRSSRESQEHQDWRSIADSARLVAFIATPHTGASLASSLRFLFPRVASKHIELLRDNSDFLYDLNESYRYIASSSEITTAVYYEKFKAENLALVVDRASADPGVQGSRPIAIDADHITIVKPKDRDAPLYKGLCRALRSVLSRPQASRNRTNASGNTIEAAPESGAEPSGPAKSVQSYTLDLNREIRVVRTKSVEKLPDVSSIRSVAIHPTGNVIAYAQDFEVYWNDIKGPAPFAEPVGSHGEDRDSHSGEGHAEHRTYVTDISFHPDGVHLISADTNGSFRIWRFQTAELTQEISAHTDAVTSLSVSMDGQWLATASYDEFLKVWSWNDLLNGNGEPYREFYKQSRIKKPAKYTHDTEYLTAVRFSKNGRFVATGDRFGNLVIRHAESGREVFRKRPHNDEITGIEFNPEAESLVCTSSLDSRIRLINLDTPENIETIGVGPAKHQQMVASISFSYKGDVLVSSGHDNLVKVWDFHSRSLLKEFSHVYSKPIDKVAFFPNRYDLATDSISTDISLWQISNEGDVDRTSIDFQY